MIINDELAVLTRAASNFGISVLEKLFSQNKKPGLICVEKVTFKKRFS